MILSKSLESADGLTGAVKYRYEHAEQNADNTSLLT